MILDRQDGEGGADINDIAKGIRMFSQDGNEFKLIGEDSLLEFDDEIFVQPYLWEESHCKDPTETCSKGEFLAANVFKHGWLTASTKIKNYKPILAERRNSIKFPVFDELSKELGHLNLKIDQDPELIEEYLEVFRNVAKDGLPFCSIIYSDYLSQYPEAKSSFLVSRDLDQRDPPLEELDYRPFYGNRKQDPVDPPASAEESSNLVSKAMEISKVKKKGKAITINDMLDAYEE